MRVKLRRRAELAVGVPYLTTKRTKNRLLPLPPSFPHAPTPKNHNPTTTPLHIIHRKPNLASQQPAPEVAVPPTLLVAVSLA